MVKRSVLLLCGDYVEDSEVMVPFQALQACRVKVDAVCPGKKSGETCVTAIHDFLGFQTYSESAGHKFALNKTFDEVNVDCYDALLIPGGRAPEYLALDKGVLDIVQKFNSAGKIIASICHGQLILAAAGLLKGKKCTSYPAVKPILVSAGGTWQETGCFQDGSLITAQTYLDHPQFIRHLLDSLGAKFENSGKKVLMFCGDYMEDYEAMVPYQTLLTIGYTVDAVCPGKVAGEKVATAVHDFEGAQTYSEKRGHNFTLNAAFDNVRSEDYDGLLIPGGRAPEYLALDKKVIAVTREFAGSEKSIASICHGQQILSAAGVLKGKRCTAYPALKPLVVSSEAHWVQPEPLDLAVTDGNLVTAAVWTGHPEFIAQFISVLGTKVLFE